MAEWIGRQPLDRWPSGWCIGLRSWLRGFDAQLGHLYDACTSLPQKSQAAIKWLQIRKKKKKMPSSHLKSGQTANLVIRLLSRRLFNKSFFWPTIIPI